MKKNLSLFIVLSSFVFLVSLGIVVFNNNLVKDTTSQLASVVGPLISNVKVSKITLNGATISWTTDMASTSKLETKKAWTSTWILATDDPANTTDHSIEVGGLIQNTKYSYRVTSCDNTNTCKTWTSSNKFTTAKTIDTESPSIPTNLAVSYVTDTTAILNWTASTDNVGVTGYNLYKKDSNGNVTKKVLGNIVTYNVTGLTPGQERSFWLEAFDATGNISAISNAVVFTTTGGVTADTSPTAPTGLTSSNITQTSATISWTASTDNVGVTGYDVYKNGTLVTSVTSTTASLTGLTAGTTYSITVKAKDAAGNVSPASSALSVTTVAADTTAPTISAINSTPNDTGVTITWTTNEASDSQISYGPTTSYGTTSILNATLVTSHSVTVTGLTSGTLYHFKVTSKDASTNSASSTDQTFTTTTPTPACLNAVTNPADARDVWAWHGNTQLITPNSTFQTKFFNYADSHKVQTIYLNANASFVNNNATNIKDFLNKAKAHCMNVEALGGAENWVALPGNPYFTQGTTTTAALDFATAVKNLNNSVTGNNAKFSAIQYDVEPHTIGSTDGYYPYYGLSDANYTTLQANTAIINALIDMTQQVRAITGSSVKVNLAPPRWYDTSANLTPFSRTGVGVVAGKNAMTYLFDNVDILSIQDYVNNSIDIHDDAIGELNYAAATGKKVNIGILLDNSAPASSNFFGSTCANLNSTLQGAYDLMTATQKSAFSSFAIEQYDTLVGYNAGTPSSWTAMCP